MYARKGHFYSRTEKHGSRCKIFLYTVSLKPVHAFQTLMPATHSKWATTNKRAFFLSKTCSCTLLPGSIWLQMPITQLSLCLKFQNTFYLLKTCWWRTGLSRLYDAFEPQAGIQGTLKQYSKAAHLFPVPWCFLWCWS